MYRGELSISGPSGRGAESVGKLIVLGVDGATWRVLDPLLAAGRLPNFARLIAGGAAGTLVADARMLASPTLWTTIYTGKTVAKHGVRFFGATARSVRAKRLWEIFADQGFRIGVCGELVTWPPRPVDGFLIPDLFALGPETYPEGLRFLQEIAFGEKARDGQGAIGKRLDRLWRLSRHGLSAGTVLAVASYFFRRRLTRMSDRDVFWRKALIQPRLYTDVFVYLCRTYRPQFASFHFHTTDTFGHRYWKYWAPQDFPGLDPAEIRRYRDLLPRAYELADQTLGRLLRLADAETTVAVISDHGISSAESMKYKFELRVDRLLDALNLAGMAVPARLGDTYVLYFRDQAAQRRAAAVLEQLEIEQMGQRLFTVRVAEEYVSLMRKVKDRSLEGMSFVAPGFQRLQFDDLFENRGFLDSGTHHPDGILILSGRGVRRGVRLDESVGVDVAPTLLALAGLPVARDQDGRVLVEAIDPDFLTAHPIRFIESYEESYARSESPAEEAAKSTAEEDAVLRERLRGLGYL